MIASTTNFMMMRRVLPEDALMMLGLVAIVGCFLLFAAACVLLILAYIYCYVCDLCEAIYNKLKSKKKGLEHYDS